MDQVFAVRQVCEKCLPNGKDVFWMESVLSNRELEIKAKKCLYEAVIEKC